MIAYFFGIIGGIVIYLVSEEKDKFLRFHAKQSILFNVFAAIIGAIIWGISIAAMTTAAVAAGLGMMVVGIIYSLILFIIWIVLMVKAYQGEKYKLPVIGNWAE
ncbi:MAG: DUF4870 domain-containing protein [Candidatus Aminicenantales bacterium]